MKREWGDGSRDSNWEGEKVYDRGGGKLGEHLNAQAFEIGSSCVT